MNLSVSITDNASPALLDFVARLRTRRPLHQAMGNRVKALVRDHVIDLAGKRHDTATRLGADPSGFLGKAVENVERSSPKSDAEGVTINLNHPAFARAFGDVEIKPKSGKFLTIPLVQEAYNQRAYRIKGLFVYKTQKGGLVLAKADKVGGKVVQTRPWYLLVSSVRQSRDRSLLPSDEKILEAAKKGVADYVEILIKRNSDKSAKRATA